MRKLTATHVFGIFIITSMDKDNLLQLTDELYNLTLLFPRKEPLRYKMREQADEILAEFLPILNEINQGEKPEIAKNQNRLFKAFDVLDGFLEIAKLQNWTSPSRVLKLREKYLLTKESIKTLLGEVNLKPETVPLPSENHLLVAEGVIVPSFLSHEKLNERQKTILKVLKEEERIQVWQLKKIFPDISKRTLRRDFEYMFNQGLVERLGERNDTYYRLKG